MKTEFNQIEKIDDIVKVLNGGLSFYEDAMEHVKSHQIETVFGKMILQKRTAIAKLQPYAKEQTGDVEEDTSFTVELRKLYAKALSAVSSDADMPYVDQLEEVEEQTVKLIKEALEQNQLVALKQVLSAVLRDAEMCLDEMKTLQNSAS